MTARDIIAAADQIAGMREALEAIVALAETWAYQVTDYDEDCETQIADGQKLLDLLASHGLHDGVPEWCLRSEYFEPYGPSSRAIASRALTPEGDG